MAPIPADVLQAIYLQEQALLEFIDSYESSRFNFDSISSESNFQSLHFIDKTIKMINLLFHNLSLITINMSIIQPELPSEFVDDLNESLDSVQQQVSTMSVIIEEITMEYQISKSKSKVPTTAILSSPSGQKAQAWLRYLQQLEFEEQNLRIDELNARLDDKIRQQRLQRIRKVLGKTDNYEVSAPPQ